MSCFCYSHLAKPGEAYVRKRLLMVLTVVICLVSRTHSLVHIVLRLFISSQCGQTKKKSTKVACPSHACRFGDATMSVSFRIYVNLVHFTRSNSFCQSMRQAHNSTSISKTHSDIFLRIPSATTIPFPLQNPN